MVFLLHTRAPWVNQRSAAGEGDEATRASGVCARHEGGHILLGGDCGKRGGARNRKMQSIIIILHRTCGQPRQVSTGI